MARRTTAVDHEDDDVEEVKLAQEVAKTIGGLDVLSVAEHTDWFKGLIFGDTGAGKTVLSGSAAEVEFMSPVLFIDIEGGTKSLRNRFPDVDVVRLKDELDDDGDVVRMAWQKMLDLFEDIKRGDLPYQTYVIDSATELHAICMRFVTERGKREDPSKDVDVPNRADWNRAAEKLRVLFRGFRNLEANVIITALERSTKDEKTGSVKITPSLPGQLASQIPAMFDEVFYLKPDLVQSDTDDDEDADDERDGKEVARYLLTAYDGKHAAKDRSDRLPLYMTNPTMSDIVALVLDRD